MSENLRAQYTHRVQLESTGAGNKIKAVQKRFPVDGVPVFLKTKLDNRMYRGLMVGSVLGIAASGLFITMMATGTMPKKGQS